MSPIAEYEVFEYKHFDEPVLSLNEAAAKAAVLRKSDPDHIYRVMPREEGFIIVKMPVTEVQATRWGAILGRFLRLLPMPRTR